jgi:hypothetical protein
LARAQDAGALHSRTIENRMAAANNARNMRLLRIIPLSHDAEYGLKNRKLFSEPHDVVSAIDVNNFAGDTAAGVRGKKYSSRADFFDVHVAAQWSSLGV